MPDPHSFDLFLRLSLLPGMTAHHLRRLRETEHEPFLPGLAEKPPGLPGRALAALFSRKTGENADRIRAACDRAGVRIIPFDDPEYPGRLREIPDAPLVLYRRGEAIAEAERVAIVGSRAPTAAGLAFARDLAYDLSRGGWMVVSGMARGIDTAAHEGALRSGARTIAVLGCGADVVYPPESRKLWDRIAEQGAIVSEYPPGTKPYPHHFPARNRIVSGLCRGVVVAEAPARSGALITARLALDQGREVMAVPGSPLFPHTAGSNRLLQEGAAPIVDAADVDAALGVTPESADAGRVGKDTRRGGGTPAAGSRRERAGESAVPDRRILAFLSVRRHVNELVEALGIPVPELLPRLLDMEFRKLLERLPGDYYKVSEFRD